jgi:hypothetical protein
MTTLFTPLQSLADRWTPSRRRSHRLDSSSGLRYVGIRPSPSERAEAPANARPVRVMRMVDAQQPNRNSSCVVISGRMADVCAELDRLAALEASDTAPPRARMH